MDFTNRSPQPQPAAPSPHTPAPAPSGGSKRSRHNAAKWERILNIVLLASIVIILLGVIFVISKQASDNEGTFVDTSKLQAVFLNTGQVYFGKVTDLNSKYFVLTNIYYLQTSGSGAGTTSTTSSNTNSSVSLVKLGCELHQPYDQMVINRSQVTFWENLQSTGQVAKAVAAFQQKNPHGQTCSDQSSSASTTSGNATQSAGSASTSTTTPATSTTTKQ